MNISAVSNAYQTQAYNAYPASSGPVVADDNGGFGGFSTDFTSISSMVAHAGGGGFAAYKLSGNMAESIKTIFGKGSPPPTPGTSGFGQNLMTGLKGVAINGAKGAGLSALVSAGVSAVANGVGVATGKIDSSEAVGNVVKDTIGGAVGGLTGVTAAGIGQIFLGRFGTIGTVASVALGAVGGVAGGRLASKLTEGF